MSDKSRTLLKTLGLDQPARSNPVPQPSEDEADEGKAFGYWRGVRDRALAIELRLRTGDREYFSYGHLVSWRYNPSVGLLLKFTDDVVTLVLIRGSNLDALAKGSINLTDRGLQRHRILWVREMEEAEVRRAGDEEPIIDRIEVAEFPSNLELQEWLKENAPLFVRKER